VTAPDLFRRVVAFLDETGIPYLLTGSFESSHHGVRRDTLSLECPST